MPVSRQGTASRSSSIPRSPLAPISSTAEEVSPRRAHVLDGDDGAGRHQFEAGFQQQLFGEGIADLHRRAFFLSSASASKAAEAMVAP